MTTLIADTQYSVVGLDSLGYGVTDAYAYDISNNGFIAGMSLKSGVNGKSLGSRAVYWLPGDTAPTELAFLEMTPTGQTSTYATDVNDGGAIVGFASDYMTGNGQSHAVMWLPDSVAAVDLNELVDPASGWTLTKASGINNDGWIIGNGIGPDGYNQPFVLAPVPEPGSIFLLSTFIVLGLNRRRHV